MKVYAQGKNIPTYQFARLFTQGENCADSIIFTVDRFYGGNDLAECDFCIVGVTKEKWEAVQIITPVVGDDSLILEWRVDDRFTRSSGKLELEIRASKGDALMLKYDMQPVFVKPALEGEGILPPYTAVCLTRCEVIALTKEQYDSTEHKADSLYVIIQEG